MGCKARLPTRAWSRIGNVPKRMSPDVHWLLVYVILSRVRAFNSPVSFGFSDTLRDVIEGGPPDECVGRSTVCSDPPGRLPAKRASSRDGTEARTRLLCP